MLHYYCIRTQSSMPLVLIYTCIKLSTPPQQMYLTPLVSMCQWWHWMKQARSESLGANQHWDLVKWSLVTLCSTGEGEPPLTSLAQCLALVQPHTPSPTSILVQCMKWELHQWAFSDGVGGTAAGVGVGSKLLLTTVSVKRRIYFRIIHFNFS